MLFTNHFEKQLRRWGKKKQQVPARVLATKEKILQNMKTEPLVPRTRPYRWVWGLSGALAVLVIFVGQYYIKHSFMVATTGSGQYATDFAYAPSSMPLSKSNGYGEQAANIAPTDFGIQDGEATALSNRSYGDVLLEKVSNLVSTGQEMAGSIADNREFLKYNYFATLKTRKVAETTARLQTIVRGHGGRVDNILTNEKFGSINFVVPKSSFEVFKNEVQSLARVKLYTESIHGQNLLPEKVSIENSVDVTNQALASWKEKLLLLNKEHDGHVAYMQKQLSDIAGRVYKLRQEVTTSSARQQEINKELSRLAAKRAEVQKNLDGENQYYNSRKLYFEDQIKNTQSELENLEKQDKDLLQNVETVEGSLQVKWVSIFEIITIYCPYWWALIIAVSLLLLVFNYYSKRRVIKIS